jgi:hypothetical protein
VGEVVAAPDRARLRAAWSRFDESVSAVGICIIPRRVAR